MTTWTSDESSLGSRRRISWSSPRCDGTLRKPVTIWVVRVGDDLYVRSWRGRAGSWYRTAQDSHEGRISAGGRR
jgi:hypothetical protein